MSRLRMKRMSLADLIVTIGCCGVLHAAATPADHMLWSDRPVLVPEAAANNLRTLDKIWSEEIYPMCNRCLGYTVFGQPVVEYIQFNEDSLWVGNEHHTGRYQPFGDLYIKFGHKDHSNYHSELDIGKAVQTVSYVSGGVTYTREYIASHLDQLMAFRFCADEPCALSGEIWLDSMHRSQIAADQGHSPEAMKDFKVERGQSLVLTATMFSK